MSPLQPISPTIRQKFEPNVRIPLLATPRCNISNASTAFFVSVAFVPSPSGAELMRSRFQPNLAHLPVKRGAADAESLGDFRHAPAVTPEGKPDHVRLNRLERADVTFLAQGGNAHRIAAVGQRQMDRGRRRGRLAEDR